MTAACMLAASTIAMAQAPFTIDSTFPTSKATNVDLNVTVSFTFDQAIPLHLTIDDLDEYIDVSPRADIRIHDVYFSTDRRSIEYNVTHEPDVDYNWTVTGPHPIDRFHLLSYTTASSYAQGRVSGNVSHPGLSNLIGFEYGYVFLVPDSTLDFWDETPRLAGISTIELEGGTYDITGVRPGTYYAYSLITSDPEDSESMDAYFGFYDANGDSRPDPIVVGDTPIGSIHFMLTSINDWFPSSHSHAKMTEIRELVIDVTPNAGLKSIVGFQMLQNGDVPDGSSHFWTYMWHDNTAVKSVVAMMSGEIVEVEEIDDESIGELASLPESMISSSIAVKAVMESGAAAFLERMPDDAMIIVMQMAGVDISQYGYEGTIPNEPFWFINIVSVYASAQGSVTEVYFALVHALSGDVLEKTPTSIEKPDQRDDVPASITLNQNVPNPFNPSTVIGFTVGTQDLASVQTRLSVYDLLGREVAVLVDGVMPAGEHRVSFDASGLSSGVYLYRLQSGSMVETRRMTLVK